MYCGLLSTSAASPARRAPRHATGNGPRPEDLKPCPPRPGCTSTARLAGANHSGRASRKRSSAWTSCPSPETVQTQSSIADSGPEASSRRTAKQTRSTKCIPNQSLAAQARCNDGRRATDGCPVLVAIFGRTETTSPRRCRPPYCAWRNVREPRNQAPPKGPLPPTSSCQQRYCPPSPFSCPKKSWQGILHPLF